MLHNNAPVARSVSGKDLTVLAKLLFGDKHKEHPPHLLRILWAIEGGVITSFARLVKFISPDRASSIGRWLMRMLGPRMDKTRLMRRNLRLAFPEKQAEEIDDLIRDIWGNLGSVMAEYPHLGTICGREADQRLDYEIKGDPQVFRDHSKPAVFVSAHLANWELAAGAIVHQGIPFSAVYTTLQNPSLDHMLFKARHFVEYFPAFALIFAALAWTPLIERWLAFGGRRVNLELALDQVVLELRNAQLVGSWRSRALVGLMVGLLLPAVWLNLNASREGLERSKPYERYAEAAAWLEANTPAGARVFQTDWDDFTRLFFYNTHNTYTLGLDPTYMQNHDSELYDLWRDISKGRVERPSEAINGRFGGSYVLTDLKHKDFLREAGDDPDLIEVFRDEYAVVFQVVASDEMKEVAQTE